MFYASQILTVLYVLRYAPPSLTKPTLQVKDLHDYHSWMLASGRLCACSHQQTVKRRNAQPLHATSREHTYPQVPLSLPICTPFKGRQSTLLIQPPFDPRDGLRARRRMGLVEIIGLPVVHSWLVVEHVSVGTWRSRAYAWSWRNYYGDTTSSWWIAMGLSGSEMLAVVLFTRTTNS